MVNFDLYKIFYMVARYGSLTKASEELYISQPAISQAIKQLESQLGTPLFKRVHKGMALTKQGGELVFHDVEQAIKLLNGVEERLSSLREHAGGTLRIGASETIFQYCLSEKIVEFHNLYPQVKLELLSDMSPVTVQKLKTDKCDIGFLNLPVEVDGEVSITDSIMQLHDIFIAGEAFAELKDRQITARELQEYPLLLMEPNTVSRTSVDNFMRSIGVHIEPMVEVDSWGFMKRLVGDGMGIGCLPREYAVNKLQSGTFFEVNVTPALPPRSVGMALPKNVNMTFALGEFIRLLRKED